MNNNLLRSMPLICKVFILILLFIPVKILAEKHDSQEQAIESFGAIKIGRGFVTYNNQVLPSGAAIGFNVIKTAPEGSAELKLIENKDMLAKHLGIHGSADVPVKALQFKNLANFLNQHKSSRRSISLLYITDWSYRYEIQTEPGERIQISDEALAEYKKSPQTFVSSYGNSFIIKSRAGSSIFIVLKLHFDSSEAKTSFEEKMNVGKENILSVMENFKAFVTTEKQKSVFNIHVLQLGGTPEKLGEIFEDSIIPSTSGDGAADVKSNPAEKHPGVNSAGFDVANLQTGLTLVSKVTEYLTSLPQQVKPDNPETLFVFGDFETQSYHSVNSAIGALIDGGLQKETIQARTQISEAFERLQKIKDIKIPFYTFKHFQEKFETKERNLITQVATYKEKLEEFFEYAPDNYHVECFQAGFEDTACLKAQAKLKSFELPDIEKTLEQLKLLNFSISIADMLASYPVAFPKKAVYEKLGKKLKQRLVSFDLNQTRTHGHLILLDHTDTSVEELPSMKELAATNDNMIYSFDLTKDEEILSKGLAHKTDSNVFAFEKNFESDTPTSWEVPKIKCKGNNITFYNDFYFPYPKGRVCLHLPAGAGFVGTIKNKNTNQVVHVSVFRTGKIDASIGDEIEIKPVLGSTAAAHTFRVTKPYDDNDYIADQTKKLPLHTTIYFKGSVRKSHASLVYNDENCF